MILRREPRKDQFGKKVLRCIHTQETWAVLNQDATILYLIGKNPKGINLEIERPYTLIQISDKVKQIKNTNHKLHHLKFNSYAIR